MFGRSLANTESAQESGAKLNALSKSQAIIEFDLNGTTTAANQNFLRIFGYTLEEVLGQHHGIFLEHAERNSAGERAFWESLLRGEPCSGEFRRMGKGGKEIWLHASYNPVLDRNGKPVKIFLIASDTTQEAQLRKECERVKLMVDKMPLNVMMCDPETFIITYLNETSLSTLKQLEHLLPVKAEQVVGSPMEIFHKHPERQRRMVIDPKNLPHRAKIKLGPETLDLNIAAIVDDQGKYLGPMLAWSIVTKQVVLADNFESGVKTLVENVTASAQDMQATAQSLAATAEETNAQSTSVATASEELSASLTEITRQLEEATRIVNVAVNEAGESDRRVSELLSSTEKINEVTHMIAEIASQTNLLALNATIEASRAGEAGKGFAVVASEVKSLASRTADATREIGNLITGIQESSKATVAAIQEIVRVIPKISEVNATISQAVEQQSIATKEVSQNIIGVKQSATETGRSSDNVLQTSDKLLQRSVELQGKVDEFLVSVRAL